MLPREYETLRAVEDEHWWYAVLRGLVLREVTARLPQTARVLDAGCGTGGMIEVLRREHPQWELHGIDAEAAAIRHCFARGQRDVRRGDVAALPFADADFDAVLSLDVLYHAGVEEGRALREMARVLRPGGVLVVNLPAFAALRGSHDAAVCGVRRYNACHVRHLLEFHSLRVVTIHYWNVCLSVPLLAWRIASRLLARQGADAASDVALPPRWLNRRLAALVGAEARANRVLRVPWGSSVFAVAMKSAADSPWPDDDPGPT